VASSGDFLHRMTLSVTWRTASSLNSGVYRCWLTGLLWPPQYLSVPKTHAGEAEASGPRRTSEEAVAADHGALLTSTSNRWRGCSSALAENSTSVVRSSASLDGAPKASER